MAKADSKAAKKDEPKKDEQKKNLPTTGGEKMDMGAMILSGDKMPVPDYIKQDSNRGSENVGTDDLVIPRLEVLQALSPQLDESAPEYIPGAKQGDLVNSVTRQNYGKEVFLLNVFYTKQWLVWRDRKLGGGFKGAFANPELAKDRIAELTGGGETGYEAIDTPTHLCLLINRDAGTIEEVMVSMPRTKAKVSRAWNSQIKLAGGDRFSRVYRVTSASEENEKGKFYNYVVAATGFPAKPLYAKAEALYKQMAEGQRRVVMDVGGMGDDAPTPGGGESAEM